MTDSNKISGVVGTVALLSTALAGTTASAPLALGVGLTVLLWGASQINNQY